VPVSAIPAGWGGGWAGRDSAGCCRARAFLISEQREHRGVDVDRDALRFALTQQLQTLLCDQCLEPFPLFGTESPQVIVECADARHGAAGQVLEERIGRQPLEIEHPSSPDHRCVNQQLYLRVVG
jgi:hypothetical protein